MTFETIGIPLSFIICSALLLWYIIDARGPWLLKTFCIATTLFFGLSVWNAVDSYMGWPTSHVPPEKFIFHWGLIREPDKTKNDSGAIYMWLKEIKPPKDDKSKEADKEDWPNLLAYDDKMQEPRVYKLPYSKEMDEAVRGAKARVAKGKTVVGEFKNGKIGKPTDGDGSGKGTAGKGKGIKGGKSGGQYGVDGWDHRNLAELRFYDLPPPKFPEKTQE